MTQETTTYRYRFGRFELDEAHFTFRQDNVVLPMPAKPWQLLLLLLQNTPKVVSHQEIDQHVWAGRAASSGTVNQVLIRLRQSLADDDQTLIKNARGVGFCFTGDVERIAQGIDKSIVEVELTPSTKLRGRQPWKLLRPLVTGARALVWLGEHQSTRELHVFKFAFDAAGKSSLKKEVLAARLLADEAAEGFLPVLHWDFTQTPFFIELPYLDAPTLADWTLLETASDAGAASLIADVASVLHSAHSAGVVHGDLSLNNVLVQQGDAGLATAVLLDFGAAQLAAVERIWTIELSLPILDTPDGVQVGRLLYAAPEVLRGEPISAASDVYSLGVMLFQVLARDARQTLSPGWENAIDEPLLRADILAMCHANPPQRPSAELICQRMRSLASRRKAQLIEQQLVIQLAKNARGRKLRGRYLAAIAVLGLLSGVALLGWLDARQKAQHQQQHLAQVDQLLSNTPEARAKNVGFYLSQHISAKIYAGSGLAAALKETLAAVEQDLKNEPDLQFEAYLELAQTASVVSDQRLAVAALSKLALLPRNLQPQTLTRSEFNYAVALYLSGDSLRARVIFLRLADEFKRQGEVSFSNACLQLATKLTP